MSSRSNILRLARCVQLGKIELNLMTSVGFKYEAKKLPQASLIGYRLLFTQSTPKASMTENFKPLNFGHPELLASQCSEDIHLSFGLNASEITKLCDYIISQSQSTLDSIGSTPPEECSLKTVIQRLGALEGWVELYSSSCRFPLYVATTQEVRSAAAAATDKLDKHQIESSMRQDIYKAVKNAKMNFHNLSQDEKNEAHPEDIRLMDKFLEDFFRRGAHLATNVRDELSHILKEISSLSTQYAKNISDDQTMLLFSREELAGLPSTFIDSLNVKDGLFIVTMQYPHVHPILQSASNPETRRKAETTFNSRCKQNVPILEKALALRRKAALLLGYSCHAEFKLADKMAKTPASVKGFLSDLRMRLTPLAKEELKTLLKYKIKEEPGAKLLNSWDISYFMERYLQTEFKVDQNELQQYFPVDHVLNKSFELFGGLLGVRFVKSSPQHCWSDGVDLVQVVDTLTSRPIGYFYLDLFPRDGKFTHAACFPLQPGIFGQQLPVAAMVTNFTPRGMLTHSEVVTFFHELGHVLHYVLSSRRWARFGGLRVEHDFVETPSQLLENWCWEKSTLESISSHADSKKPLSQSLITALIGTRSAGAGLFYLRQVAMAMFDMELHDLPGDSLDTTQLMHHIQEQVTGIPSTKGTFKAATFAHLMGGYDAGYYGYLWSLVFAADIFHSRFASENPLAAGKAYREIILESGSSRDGKSLLASFLGREPESTSFLKMMVKN
ncbi:metalloendopeptidase [Entomophthora muscae]|uniref:Metalloendopeptidase n=1 Tax=Entomophthora muscae TaxID=34485 RepID=A0ACC2RPL1_9FUNG|nr:metalloendopeptidase [Entomophthora muscae]